MPVRRSSMPQPEVGPIALRLLTVPVLLSALVAAYLVLRWTVVDERQPLQNVGAVVSTGPAPAFADNETRTPGVPAASVAHDPITDAPGRLDAADAGVPALAP